MLFIRPDAPIYEWSGPQDQLVIQPWLALNTPTNLAHVTTTLRTHQRSPAARTTAIGSAMLTGFALLDAQPDCWKRTLDLSGDGPTNTGPRPQDIADDLCPIGTVVNGLVIGSGEQSRGGVESTNIKELSSYFTNYVIRGPSAFVETAAGFEDYASAMERKLLPELESLSTSSVVQPLH